MRSVSQSVFRNSGAGCGGGWKWSRRRVVAGLGGLVVLGPPGRNSARRDCALAGGVLPLSFVIYSNLLSNKIAGEHAHVALFPTALFGEHAHQRVRTAPSPGENAIFVA